MRESRAEVGMKLIRLGHRVRSSSTPKVPAAAMSWLSVREEINRPMAM